MDKLELSKKYLSILKKDLTFDDVGALQELIKYHSDLYYNKEKPIISDFEYDELFKKLEFLEKKFNLNTKQTSLV
jgi:DNA ligase (NAD+)